MRKAGIVGLLAVWLLIAVSGVAVAAVSDGDTVEILQAEFKAYSGAELLFERTALRQGEFYDKMPTLTPKRALKAARLAVTEVKKYPRGYLGRIGLKKVAIFKACVSKSSDGFRRFEPALGGYRYYGMWNGSDAVVAAYYRDVQLPLTLHHEIFHHVDSSRSGQVARRYFIDDDGRFEGAISGRQRYKAPTLSPSEIKSLGRLAKGYELEGAVSHYASKSPGEDQAETARYLMTALPDALLQIAQKPHLAGSQRMLHVLRQYERAIAFGPDVSFFTDVALSRRQHTNAFIHKVDREIAHPTLRQVIRTVQPASVRIEMGGSGVNLRSDGLILTAAHVPDRVGRRTTVRFPDGRRFHAICSHIDTRLDLALFTLSGAKNLPTARLAKNPAQVGDVVAVVGQPGTSTPGGEATGYQPFHVSTGVVRGYLPNLLGTQSLGRMKHDAWTYWGHSGSPLFNALGEIVGIHNSWDSTTAMRHAVPFEALRAFLKRGHRELTS